MNHLLYERLTSCFSTTFQLRFLLLCLNIQRKDEFLWRIIRYGGGLQLGQSAASHLLSVSNRAKHDLVAGRGKRWNTSLQKPHVLFADTSNEGWQLWGAECWQLHQARPGVPACGRLCHICCFLFLLAELNPCRKCSGGSAQMISYCLLCKADHIPSSFMFFLPVSHHISLLGQACP